MKTLILFITFFLLNSNAYGNSNLNQWGKSDKTYKDLINEGFEVKSYSVTTLEQKEIIMLFITVLQKNSEVFECQEYQTLNKKFETIDMFLTCKELIQPFYSGLDT